MDGVKHTLCGSTLTETLVTMLVAGIVFLAAMETLTLLSRLVARRTAALVETGRQSDGIFRIGQLIASADSVHSEEGGFETSERLYLYRSGHETALTASDSTVLFVAGTFRDTLLRHVKRMRLMHCDTAADTVEIATREHLLKFPIRINVRYRYETTIAEIENGYGYEEEHP